MEGIPKGDDGEDDKGRKKGEKRRQGMYKRVPLRRYPILLGQHLYGVGNGVKESYYPESEHVCPVCAYPVLHNRTLLPLGPAHYRRHVQHETEDYGYLDRKSVV